MADHVVDLELGPGAAGQVSPTIERPSVEAIMRHWRTGTTPLLLALTIGGCAPTGPLTEEDLDAIAGVRESFEQGAVAGEWAALAALHTEDGQRLPPNSAIVTGRVAIEADMASFGAVSALTITAEETTGYGDMAYDRGTYTVTFTPPEALEAVSDTGNFVTVLERQRDGSWQIALLIWNSNLPLPEM